MTLTLQREPSDENRTFGVLFVDGHFECFVLEDPVRPEKIMSKTAVPPGKYQILRTFSSRFKRILPILLDVPGFSGVRIHPGNTEHDTEGCLLPGVGRAHDRVISSRIAFDRLDQKISAALAQEEVWIYIRQAEGTS